MQGVAPSAEAGHASAQVGHLKTVIILAGGFLIFNEAMPPKKLAGVALSLTGIIWCAAWAKARQARPHCVLLHVSAQEHFLQAHVPSGADPGAAPGTRG